MKDIAKAILPLGLVVSGLVGVHFGVDGALLVLLAGVVVAFFAGP